LAQLAAAGSKARTTMSILTDSAMIQTVRAELKDTAATGPGTAVLVQIYPPCLNMGVRVPLPEKPLEIGRGETCDLRINHSSVSRRHARIKPTPGGYRVIDLESTNGTFLNDVQVAEAPLKDGDYLRIGSCMFRFLMGSNLEAQYHEEIYRLTIIDALTDVHNKRYFQDFLERELVRAARHQHPLSLVFFDLDRFKKINDERGHLCGDHVLREVAGRVRSSIRREELLARYGGEEFAVVLPDTRQEDAVLVAERIRALVGTKPFEYDAEVFTATVSLGVASTGNGQLENPAELIRQADEALYQAKRAGRNCVCSWTGTDVQVSLPPASQEESHAQRSQTSWPVPQGALGGQQSPIPDSGEKR
jgi:diguanylate cyclase (GGDEF)-like protein